AAAPSRELEGKVRGAHRRPAGRDDAAAAGAVELRERDVSPVVVGPIDLAADGVDRDPGGADDLCRPRRELVAAPGVVEPGERDRVVSEVGPVDPARWEIERQALRGLERRACGVEFAAAARVVEPGEG